MKRVLDGIAHRPEVRVFERKRAERFAEAERVRLRGAGEVRFERARRSRERRVRLRGRIGGEPAPGRRLGSRKSEVAAAERADDADADDAARAPEAPRLEPSRRGEPPRDHARGGGEVGARVFFPGHCGMCSRCVVQLRILLEPQQQGLAPASSVLQGSRAGDESRGVRLRPNLRGSELEQRGSRRGEPPDVRLERARDARRDLNLRHRRRVCLPVRVAHAEHPGRRRWRRRSRERRFRRFRQTRPSAFLGFARLRFRRVIRVGPDSKALTRRP